MTQDPQESYEAEQARYREEFGISSGDDEDDVHIDIPPPVEIRPEVWRDVDPLLFKGFICQSATINNVRFVFKSLNHHEFELIGHTEYSDPKDPAGLQKLYSQFLAYGVFMVDGVNILPTRDEWLPELVEVFSDFEKAAREKVVFHLSELNRRANRAVVLTEAYAMESMSRLRWAQIKGMDPMITSVTGVPGTERLGLNWGQLTWRALNYYEDLRDTSEREWENAKFVASAMAGKGMNRVHSQDKRRRRQEQEDRSERRDKILRFAVLGEPVDSDNPYQTKIVANTVEELSKQLEKDLRGEKDWHDMVVDAAWNRMTQERADKIEQIRKIQESADNDYNGRSVVGSTTLEGLSPEEARFRVQRRRQIIAQQLASSTTLPEEFTDPKMGTFAEKWVPVPNQPRRGVK